MCELYDIPRKGWQYLYMEDTMEDCDPDDELTAKCNFCGTPIRYKHFIEHAKYGVIAVGRQCCDKLTENYMADSIEAQHKRDMDCIRTLMQSRRWRRYKNGYFINYRGLEIKIWDNTDDDNGYCLQVYGDRYSPGYETVKLHQSKYYTTLYAAVKKAYYFITSIH